MARTPDKKGKAGKPPRAGARATAPDYAVSLDEPAASPLDFVNRRMQELDRPPEE